LAWAQSEGLWRGISDEGGDVHFYVTGSEVEGFSIYAYLTGGSAGSGWLWLGIGPAMPISGNSFSFSGSLFDVTGTFTSSSTSTGTYDYHDPYLGYSSGTWTANFLTDPYITLSPSSHGFGDHTINTTSSAVTFTLSNKGGGSATGSVSLTGTNADQFEITSGGGSFSLSRDQSKDIYVRFAPTSAGWKTATLMVDGDSPCNDVSAYLTLQRHFAQCSHLFDLPFSMRLISKVIPILNPSHQFQSFVHVESPQGQNHLQKNPKLRERNGRCFFSPILFSNAREKNEPACTSTCGGSILQTFLLRTDPSPARSWSLRSIAL
jgi:hypothetical protein